MNRVSSKQVALGLGAACALAAAVYGEERPTSVESSRAARAGQEARRCVPGPGATGAPRSVEQVVELANSLPMPVTIACLIESLDRPLKVFATRSAASLQSSTGPKDPRYFIFSLPLLIAVTSDGPGADLVEMSVLQPGNQRSVKAELRFPLSGKVSAALPYERIRQGAGTTCSFFCHSAEARDLDVPHAEAFVSRAIRPAPDTEVSLAFLKSVQSECGSAASSPRCELLQAILAGGDAVRAEFPAEMPRASSDVRPRALGRAERELARRPLRGPIISA